MRKVSYIDIGYQSAQEFWDEIVLASEGRFKTDPTRAHAMAVAIYVTHFLDWVFCEKNPGEDVAGVAYAACRQRHHKACPPLAWLADLAEVPQRRTGSLRRLTEGEASEFKLVLADGTQHSFADVVTKAVAYWRVNR